MASRVLQTAVGNLGGGPDTQPVTFPGAQTAGNANFVCAWGTPVSASAQISIVDSAGNTYALKQFFEHPNTGFGLWIFACASINAAATNTVSVSWTSGNYIDATVIETLPITGFVDVGMGYQYGGAPALPTVSVPAAVSGNWVLSFAQTGGLAPDIPGTVDGAPAIAVTGDTAGSDPWAIQEGIALATPSVSVLGVTGVYDNWSAIAIACSFGGGGGSGFALNVAGIRYATA